MVKLNFWKKLLNTEKHCELSGMDFNFNGSLILGFQPWGIIMNIACSSVKSIMKMLIDSGHKVGLTNIIQ